MKLTHDWTASTPAERAINLILRPFGLDCFVERHQAGWQWGVDLPDEHSTALHLWVGPFHAMVSKV